MLRKKTREDHQSDGYLFKNVLTIYLSIVFHAIWNKTDLKTGCILPLTNTGNQKIMEIEFQKSTNGVTNNSLL
jgi:hypothetical protein